MKPRIILGIDPGTGRTGWALLQKHAGAETLLDYGCFETKTNSPLPQRLEKIYDFLTDLVKKHHPTEAAVEELFFATNAKTAMSVGAARGTVLLALQKARLSIYNYTPLQIKSAITGYGQADKRQIQLMVTRILKLDSLPKSDDAADAIAVALTHSATAPVLQ